MRVSFRRVAAATALLAALAPVAGAGAERNAAGAPCGQTAGLTCKSVVVPLDRSGRVPGTISLHVQVLPAEPQRGVMFLVAGGPGQGSADVFDLDVPEYADDFRDLFPGYTLVAVDGRGTGRSGPLHCPMLNPSRLDAPSLAAACAKRLGSKRDFYGTPDHAEDLEAVRDALGYRSIGLFGVSYGSKLVLSYALAHPSRVERVLLDSVSLPEGDDPFLIDFFSQFRTTLARFCGNGACRAATGDFVGDVAAVANALTAKPVRGTVLQPGGGRKTVQLGGFAFLGFVVEADLNPAIAAELPAATHAARYGDPAPLLRLYQLAEGGQGGLYPSVNLALFMATTCRDGPFPWTPDLPIAERPQLLSDRVAALSPHATAPFGRWASRSGNAQACVGWPTPKGGATLGRGPLPDVPMLALSGDRDLRTPTHDAASVVSRFRQGHLLVVPGSGHSVLGNDYSGCAETAVHAWLAGRPVRKRCSTERPMLAPLAAFPTTGDVPETPAGPRQTVELVSRTLREAQATWLLLLLNGEHRAAGLRGGTLTGGETTFKLSGYSIEPGVRVTGDVLVDIDGPPLSFAGSVNVSGPGASQGVVVLHHNGRLEGFIGGRLVRL